jgi:hypothetical protein
VAHGAWSLGALTLAPPYAIDGFSLAPEVSRTLSDLGITLEFEIAND